MIRRILRFLNEQKLFGIGLLVLVRHLLISVSKRYQRETDLLKVAQTVISDVPAQHVVSYLIVWMIDDMVQPLDGRIEPNTWISTLLKAREPILDTWRVRHCLFGLHLLADRNDPVSIVESERSAIILSEIFPENIWLAVMKVVHFLRYAHKHKCQHKTSGFLLFFFGELSTINLTKMAKNELIHEVIHFIHN